MQKILESTSFKDDINNNKLSIQYLHKYSNTINKLDPFKKAKITIDEDLSFIYTHINHVISFNYEKTNLPQTIGLININIVNIYSYYIIQTILNYQSKFISSKQYVDIRYIKYQSIIDTIQRKYNISIYKSHISNFIKKIILF